MTQNQVMDPSPPIEHPTILAPSWPALLAYSMPRRVSVLSILIASVLLVPLPVLDVDNVAIDAQLVVA